MLLSVAGGSDLGLLEVNEAAEVITAAVSPDANIIFGATIKPEMKEGVEITVVATGFDAAYFAKSDDDDDEDEVSGSVALGEVEGEVETINMDDDSPSDTGADVSDDETPFHKADDTPDPSIWASDDDDSTKEVSSDEEKPKEEHEVPAFLRRFRRRKHKDSDEAEADTDEDEK